LRTHESASSLSAIVTAGGRIYTITDLAPPGLFGPEGGSGDWYLAAQDAFNGQYLWKIPIREWGWEYWQTNWFMGRPGDLPLNLQKRLVAAGDVAYATLGYRAPVSEVDGRTGRILKTFAGTAGTNEILVKDDMLLVAVLNVNEPGKYAERPPGRKAGTGAKVKAFDRLTGKLLWETGKFYRGAKWNYIVRKDKTPGHNTFDLDPALSLATDGNVVALSDNMHVVALDAKTGEQKWSRERLDRFTDGAIRDRVTVGKELIRKQQAEQKARREAAKKGPIPEMWVGSILVVDGVVLQGNANSLIAFDADSGKQMWEVQKGWIHHLWYTWQENYVIDGTVWTWGRIKSRPLPQSHRKQARTTLPETLNAYDLKTGTLRKSIPTKSIFLVGHHHRCYRGKATENYILASHRGVEMIDIRNDRLHVDRWVRATCHIGFVPANGLLYAPPHPCRCFLNEKISYMNALSAVPEKPVPMVKPDAPGRLTKGGAHGFKGAAAAPTDWTDFRHDKERTGATPAQVGAGLEIAWETQAGRLPTAPTAAGGLLFVGDQRGSVVTALRQDTGAVVWQRQVGGPLDSPPTFHQGTVVFGAGDGSVRCLKASTGETVWRFLAAACTRQMGALGKFASVNASHGSVTVRDGLVYCTAGRSSYLDGGIQLYALDAATGEVRKHATLTGPYTDFNAFTGGRDGLPQGWKPDVMLAAPEGFSMLGSGFTWDLKPVGRPKNRVFVTQSGLLDGHFFKRTHWNFTGGYATHLTYDASSLYAFRMFDSLQALTSEVYFTPGRKGYALLKYDRRPNGNRKAWEIRVPLRAPAMLSTPRRVFLGGIPDVVPKEDPYAAYQGRLGAELYVVGAADGTVEQKLKIPAEPVFLGIAATPGRLFLSLKNGKVVGLKGNAAGK
jgi:outer membrane protein assembly factor BamB